MMVMYEMMGVKMDNKTFQVSIHCRDICYARYYGRGEGGGKWPLGKKIKNQELGKTNEKEKEQKGGKLH